MRHQRADGALEYAIHDVYFRADDSIEGYTEAARSPRCSSPEALNAWIVENLPLSVQGVVCGDLGYTHHDWDLKAWLAHVDDPPIDYESDS